MGELIILASQAVALVYIVAYGYMIYLNLS